MKFAIFSHVEHIKRNGIYYAYAPYVREMNLWLNHVKEVDVLAPMNQELEVGETVKEEQESGYAHLQLTLTEISSFHFLTFSSSIKSIRRIPKIFLKMVLVMGRADHIHLRCPGNVGLMACIGQIFFPSKPKSAKYAGNWDPKAKQPWTYRLQKWILNNTFLTRNMQVLVYGEWEGQSKNVVPFFTASFSEKDISSIKEKDYAGTLTFLFVGNLVPGKRPLEAIKLVQRINRGRDRENWARLEIYGDGLEREKMKRYCCEHGLEKQVKIHGSRPLEELQAAYQKAHFVLLPSQSEGWPKALAEGMFYGCIPIATSVSCVPWMLGYGKRGILLDDNSNGKPLSSKATPDKDITAHEPIERTEDGIQLAEIQKLKNMNQNFSRKDLENILALLRDPEEMKRISAEAKKWSQQYTLERFEEAIKDVLSCGDQKNSVEPKRLFSAIFRAGCDASEEGLKEERSKGR